jgi:long-chain fatty acid transport protein
VTLNILAPGVMKSHWTLGATWKIDAKSELTSAFMYAPREEVTGQSLFAQLGAPPTTTDTIGMRQYELGIAYQRRF